MHVTCAQVAAAHNLMENTRKTVEGRAKLGIEAFAQALLGIPKILAENSGYDAQETIIKLQVQSRQLVSISSKSFDDAMLQSCFCGHGKLMSGWKVQHHSMSPAAKTL